MLLLPTLATLSIAIGGASLAAPGLAAPATAPIPYLAELGGGDGAESLATDPELPALAANAIDYLAEVAGAAAPDGYPGDPDGALADAAQAGGEQDDRGFGPAVGTAQLDDSRGGDGNSASSIVMNGTVADNRATNVVTGANTITAGAFANASGVPMVVQNTGANVLIQNATVINLQLR